MFFVKTPSIVKRYYSGLVWDIPTEEKVIYLTFDDGPTPEVTSYVLKELSKYNAKATFFCLGCNVDKHPNIYQEIISEGHQIGNHTYHHLNGWHTNNQQYFDNVEKCSKTIDSKLFRPPYGRIKKSQSAKLIQDYKIVMWDVLSGDFDPKTTPEQCLKNVIDYTSEGSIVVFHDSKKASQNLSYALPKFLAYFHERGYRFEAIEQ